MIRLPLAAALSLTAAPLAAQSAICAGTGTNGQWIGGTEAASDIATMEGYAEQMALVLGGNDYAALFAVSAPTEVRIEAQGRGNGDPVMTLFDAGGTEIASDDDSGGNAAARAELALEPGQYCAVVRSYDNAPMTAFVRIARTEAEPLTAGADAAPEAPVAAQGDCGDALEIGAFTGSPITQEAIPAETSWLAFDLPDAQAITITATNPEADPTLRIETDAGSLLGENDDFDGLNARIDLPEAQAPGRYCIALGALGDASLPVTVEVSSYDAAAAVSALYARGEAAPPMDGTYDIADLGPLEARFSRDLQATDQTSWFRIELPQDGVLLAEALSIGPNGDPWLVIFDGRGRKVAMNDDTPDGTDALIATRVGAGPYLIGVKQVAGGTGFVRLLLERYVPAD